MHENTTATIVAASETVTDGRLSTRYRELYGRLRLLAGFASGQLLIQALGFLSGILIVRYLPKGDYAWFTIANTLTAAVAMLADCGVNGALSAVGGTIWQDNVRFGSLIQTALRLRRKLAIASILAVMPVFIWMLAKNGAPSATIAIVVPLALCGCYLQLTAAVFGVVISLRQELRRIQILGLASNLLRLVLIAFACFAVIDVHLAVLTGTCAMALQVWLLRRWVSISIDRNAAVSVDYHHQILAVVKKQAPLTIFYCLQGQILVWLVSIFGNTEHVAEIGALGRLSILFTPVFLVITGVVFPRFARCQNVAILKRRYWQIALGFVSLVVLLVGASFVFPQPMIRLLGKSYSNVQNEVWLMMLNAGLTGTFGVLSQMNLSKAWIAPAQISIPMEILTQVLLVLTFDLSTVRGVLLIGCFASVPPILLSAEVARRAMNRIPEKASQELQVCSYP